VIPPLTLTGMTRRELAALLGDPGRPSDPRAKALLRWLWGLEGGLRPLPERLPGVAREAWDRARPQLSMPAVVEVARQAAADGTIKLLLACQGAPVECVMIPARGRTTLCVSSQSGCTRHCRFCATAQMGFQRNLEAGEIVAQVLMARALAPPDRPVRNVVFMGMGEPLDNLEPVVRAVAVLTEPVGAGLSPRHITVSTSGVLPRMQEFLEASPACLALSLNGTTEAQRAAVMPIEKKWSLPRLLELIRANPERLFFIEYILMGGFNDSEADVQRLISLMTGLNVRVNLIPFNPHPGASQRRPEADRVQRFFEVLQQAGIRTMVRRSRGEEIAAACGQLSRLAASMDQPSGPLKH